MQAIKTKIKKVTSTPKGRIIGLSILIFLAASVAGCIWYWNTYKKGIIKNKLETAIHKKSQGLYKIKYDSLAMDEISGYIYVSNMHLAYDSNRYKEFDSLGKAPSILFDIQIPHIKATGVKTPRALIENEIVGRKLEINNPVIRIMYTNSGKDSTRVLPPKEVYEQILGNLDLIQADTVLINGAQIITGNLHTKDTITQIQDVSVIMTNVKVDSTSSTDTTRLLFAKKIEIVCNKLAWTSANRLYTYIADSLSISSASQVLHIKNFRMVPALNENAFVNAFPTQEDRFELSISNVQMKNINMQQLFEQNIVADNILISSAIFKIYRDLAKPRDKKNRIGTYPQQVIQKLPVGFNVKKVIVANSFIEYKERNHITRNSGKVQFYNTNVSISNFTNDKSAITENNVMSVDINARFLNKTPLKATLHFYLLHPKGRFDVKGTLGAIDATALNSLTEPMCPAHIKRGYINGLSFNLQGHNYGMDGTVKMLYDDIHVSMLEKDKGATKSDEKSLASFIANIMIKNSNPKKNEEPRVAQVHRDRDLNHSMYYLIWKTIFQGTSETVGLKQ